MMHVEQVVRFKWFKWCKWCMPFERCKWFLGKLARCACQVCPPLEKARLARLTRTFLVGYRTFFALSLYYHYYYYYCYYYYYYYSCYYYYYY